MNQLCLCGCGVFVAPGKRFIHGHYARTIKGQSLLRRSDDERVAVPPEESVGEINEVGKTTVTPPKAAPAIDPRMVPPPPHPQPFDHGKWRIAEEPAGTDLTQPWQPFRCLNCREIGWRHSEKADLCETCVYMLMDELMGRQVQQNRRMAARPIDPFRPQ